MCDEHRAQGYGKALAQACLGVLQGHLDFVRQALGRALQRHGIGGQSVIARVQQFVQADTIQVARQHPFARFHAPHQSGALQVIEVTLQQVAAQEAFTLRDRGLGKATPLALRLHEMLQQRLAEHLGPR